MAAYEVVVFKGKAGCDYIACSDKRDALNVIQERTRSEPCFERIFLRQYYSTPYGKYRYRILHKWTVTQKEQTQ